MASRSSKPTWQREWEAAEKLRAREARQAEAAQKKADREAKAAALEQKRADVEAKKTKAERQTNKLADQVDDLQSILRNGIRRPSEISPRSLKWSFAPRPFDPAVVGPLPIEPVWESYAPPPPTILQSMFANKRYNTRFHAARETFERAHANWRSLVQTHQQRIVEAQENHTREQEAERLRTEAHNRAVDEVSERCRQRDRGAVEGYLGVVLKRMPRPASFPHKAEVIFDPRTEQVAVQFELPENGLIPRVRAYRYVQARDALDPVDRPAKEIGELYRLVIAQIALLCIRDLFSSDRAIKTVAFNGHVHHTNPATGKLEYPCLISLNVDREKFEDLVLDQVKPDICLRHLEARVSPHPYELEAIMPILDFDLTKYAFVQGMDAVSTLDSRPDLMDMDPTTFEHLIRQVFMAKGDFQGWTTTPSKDDGVDAVITNKTTLVGGLVVVQAKRYKTVIGPQHIRELVGTMDEKRAGRGILVTTSWFTGGAWAKARENGRIELIDGQRLVHLIKENLGKDVLIGVDRPPNAPSGPPTT